MPDNECYMIFTDISSHSSKRTIFYLFQVGRLYVHILPFKIYDKIMKFLQTESNIGESIFPEYVSMDFPQLFEIFHKIS